MFDRIIRWSLRNPVIVLIGYALIAGAALVTIPTMSVDVFPEFAPPQVQIQTEASGYSAKDVELLVTRPIELALQGMPGTDHIRSSSSVGLSRVIVVFRANLDPYRARVTAQERLQLVQSQLPGNVGTPQMMPVTSAVSWLLKFALLDWSDEPDELALRSLVDWEFRNRLLGVPGVASVVASGGGVKQYQVLVDPIRLNSLGVSFPAAVEAARGANQVAPGAFVHPNREEEHFVRVNGLVGGVKDIAASVVAMKDGVPVTLGALADIGTGHEIKRGDGQVHGTNAVVATVSKQWGADTLTTTSQVETVLAEMAKGLPKDVQLVPDVFRQATFIERSVSNLREALIHSSIIVAVVLLLFLARWRPTVISLVAIPASLLVGTLMLWATNVGINALTLGGLVFAIGEVVDDAIIDVENVLRRLRERARGDIGEQPLEIVYQGSREIRNSVVYATLIIVAAFLPVFFLFDIEGRIFVPMAIAYLAAVVGSLLVALTLVPVLCYCLLARRAERLDLEPGWLATKTLAGYRRSLHWCIRHPRSLVAASAVLVLIAAVLLVSLGRSFLPSFSEGNIVVATTMLPGASLDENVRVGRHINQLLGDMPEIKSIAQRAGRSLLDEDAQPVNFSEFDLTLDPGVRDPERVLREIRTRLAELPGLAVNVSQFIVHRMHELLSGVRAQVVVKVYGPDLDELQRKQQEVLDAVRDVPGIVDLQAEPMILAPGLDIKVDRVAAAAYGLSAGDVVRQAGQALNGITVSRVLEADRSFDLVVRVDAAARQDLDDLGLLPLQAADGRVVSLRQVARLAPVQEPYVISRDDGARRSVVHWNVAGSDLDSVVRQAQKQISDKVGFQPGYSLEIGGEYLGQKRAMRNLILSGSAAVLLIFAFMLLAFERTSSAMLVMINLPFALIGGVAALVFAGEDLNVSSLVGLIALFGIATRNSIMLLSRYERLATTHPSFGPETIALLGAADRMLPILLTALTTGLAVVPLILGDPVGKELQGPMAVVLLGGIVSSTVLNLFVLPAAYAWTSGRHGVAKETS
ncbi:efflux RND transporter permease subunit [Rhodoplanes serenus]|uniref:efflux RND transporter permease subunit n=1 Tax=Rhodoplanes serenus TaxID=200615 RepID=UPI000DAC0721|nr:efflux RND transporter permease subunit [Rhodoplanes serenus]RAI35069.1 CusA/CzcA family heavy metal efflux RND transporter [Rhodoplanes serenus]